MLEKLKSELRAKRNALSNLFGRYPDRHLDLSTKRISKFSLIDDWMRSREAIFIHIPKAAGRSIQQALDIPIHGVAHVPAEAYRRAEPEFFARCHVFTLVRNPWDRLVSGYHFMQFNEHEYNAKVRNLDLRGISDFSGFLTRLRNPIYRNQILTRLHFMPQTHFLCDRSGQIIVDAIGRFEDLPHSFAQVTAPLAGTFTLPQRNVGKHRHYTSYYQHDWQIELVGQMYRADNEILGYQYEAG